MNTITKVKERKIKINFVKEGEIKIMFCLLRSTSAKDLPLTLSIM